MCVEGGSRCACGVVGRIREELLIFRVLHMGSGSWLERHAEEGESPVDVAMCRIWDPFLSKPGHVKSRLNPAGPSAKAKYESVTDSERVP